MKINHFLLTTKFEIFTELLDWNHECNSETYYFEKQFKYALKAWVLFVLEHYIADRTKENISRYADKYVDYGVILFKCNYMMERGFYHFMQSELVEIDQLRSNNVLKGELIAKANRYEEYLKENEDRFMELDSIISMTTFNNRNKSLLELAQKIIENPLIDLISLDGAQKELFRYLDRSYLLMLLYPTSYESYIDKEFEQYKGFDFDYYKNPPIYSGYPKQKKTYLNFLKSWILESIESRKKMMEWGKLPDAYQNLMEYANDLVSVAEIIKYPEFIDNLQMLPAPIVIEAPEYPAHIFKSFQAYRLFQTFMEAYKTPAQISFLFRMMAEIESPPLIHVKDTPFREWFNGEAYHLKLHEHTKTFTNAKNADRIDGYSIVKNLIFSQS